MKEKEIAHQEYSVKQRLENKLAELGLVDFSELQQLYMLRDEQVEMDLEKEMVNLKEASLQKDRQIFEDEKARHQEEKQQQERKLAERERAILQWERDVDVFLFFFFQWDSPKLKISNIINKL